MYKYVVQEMKRNSNGQFACTIELIEISVIKRCIMCMGVDNKLEMSWVSAACKRYSYNKLLLYQFLTKGHSWKRREVCYILYRLPIRPYKTGSS